MTWRVIGACEVGTSHVAAGKPCEDSCWGISDRSPDGVPVLCIFVADGAGTASRGVEGAELAVQAAADFVGRRVAGCEVDLNDALAVDCVTAVRRRLHEQAESAGAGVREFACTFLGLLSTPGAALALQVGDGGIVIDVGQGLELAVAPMAGEYANMTFFVTDEDALSSLATKVYVDGVVRASVFSDGVQRLALNMASNTPHAPFFDRFFSVLDTATDGQEDGLQAALAQFLGSPAVNERTDDDKTLVIAVRKA